MTVRIVTGAPCSGKSTYIREHAKPGDVVIDLDRLALALSIDGTPHHDYPAHLRHVALGAREGAIARALKIAGADVWIIQTNVSPHDRQVFEVATVDPGIDACLARAASERPGWIVPLIRQWYGGR
jgi:AAA domain